ncbi:MAG: hypothetical protein ACM3SW_19155 [Actinomycetota bacterium]
MATDNVAIATEQIKAGITNGVEKFKEFSDTLKENFETAQKEIQRGVQRSRKAVDGAIQDTRYGIRNRPLQSVAISAAGGLVIGLALGWLIGHRR